MTDKLRAKKHKFGAAATSHAAHSGSSDEEMGVRSSTKNNTEEDISMLNSLYESNMNSFEQRKSTARLYSATGSQSQASLANRAFRTGGMSNAF